MPLDRPEDIFQKFLTDMLQYFSEDVLKHFSDNMLEQSFSEISRKSTNAFVVFSCFAYFSTDGIPIDIITSVVNKEDLESVVEIGKNFLLLDANNDKNFINVNKFAQKKIRASLENSGKGKLILKSVIELLINIGKNAEKFSLLVDHAICAWLHTYNSDELLKASCALPNYIVTSLIKQLKYKKANSFGWKALKALKAILGDDHSEVLKLQFQLGNLLEMVGKYKPALRLLMGLFDKDIKDTELKMNIKLAVISVTKKIQDNSQYDEILPVYEKLLSKEKIGVTNDEAILKAWHHYALLLMNLDRSDDFLEICNDILKQDKIPLKKETKFYFINNMANAFLERTNYQKALTLFKELLEQKKIIFGENHVEILEIKCSIATVLQKLDKQNEYVTLLEEIVKQYDTVVGKTHPETISVTERLALEYYNQNECKKAAELFKIVCEGHKEKLKKNTNEILTIKQNLSPILIGDNIHPDQIKNFTAEINENSAFQPVNITVMKKNMEILSLTHSNSILSMAKESDVGKVYEVVQNGCGINDSDDLGNTPLHYASQFGNITVVKLLLDFGAIYIAKNKQGKIPLQVADNSDIKALLNIVEKLFRYVKLGNFVEVKKCIQQQRCIVNAKDNDGHHPLHWAASNGHISIVKLLLETGADPTYVTNKGNTPLHIAVSKGFLVITEVLLQFIACDELDNFINAPTLGTGATSLHVAAKKGFRDIIKILLKHGAIYNMKNNEDKTPLELFEDKTSDNILKLTEELFEDAVVGNPSIVDKLRKIPSTDLTSIANACNIQRCTLMEVMVNNNHKTLAFDCLQILKNLQNLKPWKSSPTTVPETKSSKNADPELFRVEGALQQIKSFQSLAKEHLAFSDPFILNLQFFCNLSSHLSEINPCPSRTFGDGLCYLLNAHKLVKEYKISYPNWTENVNIKQINKILDYLEFEPEPVPEKPGQFSAKADTKFHNLLHSELKKDLRLFIDLVEINIEIPVIRFLQSLTSQLRSFYSEALFKAIETNNRLIVEKYVKEDRAVLNINVNGISPLHCAINHASFKIIKILIENGADTLQKVDGGDTLLHLTASKGHKGSVELLLKHTYPDQLNKFLDAKNKTEGDTALHMAAKNGFILILKSLLKYGSCYCIRNKQGKMPIDLATKHSNIRDFLKLISQLFKYAESDNFEFGNILRSVHPEDLMAVTNARNDLGLSLLEIIKLKHVRQIPDNMLGMMLGFGKSALYNPISYDQTSYERICKIAHTFSRYSELYLSKLRYKAQIYPDDAGKNPSPWSTLKEGSLYLNNVSRFIEECKTCVGSVNNSNFLKMKETLEELQFDPTHIISEARDCIVRSFISQGQGSKYYKLLHSKLKKDILQFIYVVEKGIETPAIHFLADLKCLIVTAQPGIF
ncbi:Poly [ADP-ribose] polymerase tankyrase-2 like protein [Argiope bruennichi]|uniref:Poly [ADP-ribose] polymerase tankyrase-2 like protein n=1 Tax=Argiope bruennichi TaxID=94029 RepID=A0A8T0EP67_ARGBR|nr:Poly [ADP-ribose] polymerase tankyrase-2 like protein [Argiope bruennichi]